MGDGRYQVDDETALKRVMAGEKTLGCVWSKAVVGVIPVEPCSGCQKVEPRMRGITFVERNGHGRVVAWCRKDRTRRHKPSR